MTLILSLGVSIYGLSVDELCSFVVVLPGNDWRPVRGVACLQPNDSWDRHQPPHDPEMDLIHNGLE